MDAAAILVVEDDELVRTLLCRVLAGVAGQVDGCGSGAEAARAVRRRRYGVILLDGLLPDIHGIELAEQLLADPNARSSGICFVSGSFRSAHPLSAGISAVPKPLRMRDLTEAVHLLLQWHRSPTGSLEDRLAAVEMVGAGLLVG